MDDDAQLRADHEVLKTMMHVPDEILASAPPQVLQEFALMYKELLEIYQRKEDRLDAAIARIKKEAPGLDISVFETEQRMNKELVDESYKTLNQILAALTEE